MSAKQRKERKLMRQLAAYAREGVRREEQRKQRKFVGDIAKRVDKLQSKAVSPQKTVEELAKIEKEAAAAAKKAMVWARSAESGWGKYSRSLTTQAARGRGVPHATREGGSLFSKSTAAATSYKGSALEAYNRSRSKKGK
jgi:hypothetical protein